MIYQCCPVCDGRTTVPGGFYDPERDSVKKARELCRACGGAGILLVPDAGQAGMFTVIGKEKP